MKMNYINDDFLNFIKLDCSRKDFIQGWLLKNNVSSNVISLDSKSHILIQFDKKNYNPKYRFKTILAHYDRVENSEGANDNSVADWVLMNWAVALSRLNQVHNVRIIFTDGEELGKNHGVKELGSYSLAQTFKRLGFVNDDVIIFDCVGRGCVPLLSENKIPSEAGKGYIEKQSSLQNRMKEILTVSCGSNWFSCPLPYSDNASFIACGFPSSLITFLPQDEAASYFNDNSFIPFTWKLINSEKDCVSTLTNESFFVMEKVLFAIQSALFPAVSSC